MCNKNVLQAVQLTVSFNDKYHSPYIYKCFPLLALPIGVQTMLTKCLELQTMNKQFCHVNIEALKEVNISKYLHEIERHIVVVFSMPNQFKGLLDQVYISSSCPSDSVSLYLLNKFNTIQLLLGQLLFI